MEQLRDLLRNLRSNATSHNYRVTWKVRKPTNGSPRWSYSLNDPYLVCLEGKNRYAVNLSVLDAIAILDEWIHADTLNGE